MIRITPAYAGKTILFAIGGQGMKDHPRVCGENTPGGDAAFARAGSPPRMRGKLLPRKPCMMRFGITPAYAGKTASISKTLLTYGDHPRVCGENTLTA